MNYNKESAIKKQRSLQNNHICGVMQAISTGTGAP